MFTWICPQCGREVPPAYTECPDCAAKTAQPGAAPSQQPPVGAPVQQTQYPPPPPPQYAPPQEYAPPPQYAPPPPQYAFPPQAPQYAPPPQQYAPPQQPQYAPPPQQPYAPPPQPPQYATQQQYAPPQQQYAPPPQQPPYAPPPPPPPPQQQYAPPQEYAPPPAPQPTGTFFPSAQEKPLFATATPAPSQGGGIPTWLMTILFAVAFVGVVAGIYWLVGSRGSGSAAPSATVESPAAKPGASTNPFQKFIEVSGVRFTEDAKKKTIVKFVITNHSGADIPGLAGNVTVWGRTQKSEEEAAGTFSFSTNLTPFESKDLSAPLSTKLKIYELPDWQNVSTDVQITAPGSSSSSPAPR